MAYKMSLFRMFFLRYGSLFLFATYFLHWLLGISRALSGLNALGFSALGHLDPGHFNPDNSALDCSA